MDLCGPMRVESINGKRYVLVIVDNYSCYTWVHFLKSKDEALEEIKTFLKKITVLLQAPVIIIRTDNDTEFKNRVLNEYFDSVAISHQVSSVRIPQQNGFVERRNQTLVEATKTMLIFSRARKPNILLLHVFGALCYPKNDREDIGKLGAKGDIGFFIGYSATSCAYRVFSTWMAFKGNTHDLGSFGEETDEITDLHQILEEVLLTERGDGITSIKRHCHDLFSDSVWNLEMASRRGRLKEDLELST
ncbi:retrovirus-related pol polyprotein from transposon TNT 1-94 [Tanacetum coccineum]